MQIICQFYIGYDSTIHHTGQLQNGCFSRAVSNEVYLHYVRVFHTTQQTSRLCAANKRVRKQICIPSDTGILRNDHRFESWAGNVTVGTIKRNNLKSTMNSLNSQLSTAIGLD